MMLCEGGMDSGSKDPRLVSLISMEDSIAGADPTATRAQISLYECLFLEVALMYDLPRGRNGRLM